MGIFSFFGNLFRRRPLVPARRPAAPHDVAEEERRLEANYKKNPRHVVNISPELGNKMRKQIDAVHFRQAALLPLAFFKHFHDTSFQRSFQ
jgi:hypothetical protein